ncbi:MAG: GAF domain-containing protein [Bacteroidota bacterium]|nr:GAF domain-containing protein [Bacteroidota bacterium]
MAESVFIPVELTIKKERYEALLPKLRALVEGEPDFIANVSNLVAALKETMHFFWIGIYLVKENELVLGPFQGPVACTRIAFGKGVCGTAWKEKKTIVVDDVDNFPGHIACSSLSRSEIVLPALRNNEVFLVLDADSEKPGAFDATDEKFLGEVIKIIERL